MFLQNELSLMSFEGVQVQGVANIIEKIKVSELENVLLHSL